MSYIGNAKTPLLLSTNVRDDLIPGDRDSNGICLKKTFDLSQEVPGGEESNVTVVRKRFFTDSLVDNSTLVSIDNKTITITDNNLASVLSVIQPQSTNYEGDYLLIKVGQISRFGKVLSVSYTTDQLILTIDTATNLSISEGAQQVSLSRQYYGAWEILDAKTEYRIEGAFGTPLYNKQISLNIAPQSNDVVYVLHKGEATYNVVHLT